MPSNDKWYGKHWITNVKRLAINLRDDMRCLICLRDLRDVAPGICSLDHIICRSDAKRIVRMTVSVNHESNIYTICRICNSKRGDLPLSRFATAEALKHIKRNVKRNLAPYLRMAKAYLADKVGDPNTENLR